MLGINLVACILWYVSLPLSIIHMKRWSIYNHPNVTLSVFPTLSTWTNFFMFASTTKSAYCFWCNSEVYNSTKQNSSTLSLNIFFGSKQTFFCHGQQMRCNGHVHKSSELSFLYWWCTTLVGSCIWIWNHGYCRRLPPLFCPTTFQSSNPDIVFLLCLSRIEQIWMILDYSIWKNCSCLIVFQELV